MFVHSLVSPRGGGGRRNRIHSMKLELPEIILLNRAAFNEGGGSDQKRKKRKQENTRRRGIIFDVRRRFSLSLSLSQESVSRKKLLERNILLCSETNEETSLFVRLLEQLFSLEKKRKKKKRKIERRREKVRKRGENKNWRRTSVRGKERFVCTMC